MVDALGKPVGVATEPWPCQAPGRGNVPGKKPYLMQLPLVPFRYFEQETRTVYDDGTIQVGNSYYAANPARLGTEVTVRIP